MKDFVTSNRKKVLYRLKDGEAAVFFSGNAPRRIGDEFYPYTPDRNFYYLTGIDSPGIILMLSKLQGLPNELLFLTRPDPQEEKWTGEVLKDKQAISISGIKAIKYSDEFNDLLDGLINANKISTLYYDSESNDKDKLSALSESVKTADIFPVLGELRTVKSQIEIEYIEKAIEITKHGIYSMMKNVREGMFECELEACFDYELMRRGVREHAFASIIASGKNAATLHYSDNNCPIPKDSLVLCDVGAAYKHYSGDITRTFPSSGKFTERQKTLYNIVLKGNCIIRDYIRPGLELQSLNKRLLEYYGKALREIGLITSDDDIKEYYWHNVSHLLGLETHDIGAKRNGILTEGMVLTVEPGLYLEKEGMGIRIEDDVVVTKDGCRTLSQDIIRTVPEIEEFMKND